MNYKVCVYDNSKPLIPDLETGDAYSALKLFKKQCEFVEDYLKNNIEFGKHIFYVLLYFKDKRFKIKTFNK